MIEVEDFNALSIEIVKLDDFVDELYNNLDDYSRKTISRRLRKVGERYIFLSKAIVFSEKVYPWKIAFDFE